MKNKIIAGLFLGWIVVFSAAQILMEDETVSTSERRHLASFPDYVYSRTYAEDVEDYLLDQFPYRDGFRSIKANVNYHVLQKLDNNGVSLNGDMIFQSLYPTNAASAAHFVRKTQAVCRNLTADNHAYLAVIPDKNYYAEEPIFLHLDYPAIYAAAEQTGLPLIDLRTIMRLDDYYQTDTHWKQENLDKVVEKLSETMQFPYRKQEYTAHRFDSFYGVLYGQAAVKHRPEPLTYLTNDATDGAEVFYLENPKLHTVYAPQALDSWDAYEVFLDGASAYIEITNPAQQSGRELVVFRDSFGSSLIPLLIPYYSHITVVDNRYIRQEHLTKYLTFTDQDVLFLYSTAMINNSFSLKG